MSNNVKKRIAELYSKGIKSQAEIARKLHPEFPELSFDCIRFKAARIIKRLSNAALYKECEKLGIDPDTVNNYWYKGKHYSIHARNDKDEFKYEDFKDDLISEISKWSPNYPKIARDKYKDPHCLVFSPADIHIGKLCSSFETGEEYNQQIAVQRVKDGLQGILKKASGFDIDKVIFIAGNDILHIDTPRRTTTSGTPQDTDGMWYDNFVMAKRLLVDIIETLITVADVEVHFNPSNHDFMSGFMLLDAVSSWFRNCNQVSFNGNMAHRKYTVYGKNLIGMTHMDGAKQADLPLLMAHEAAEHWAACPHRFVYGHHIHHKISKDYMSVCVETLRSPSGTDGWHHRNGYQFAPKAVEAFIHHKEQGQIARLTHIF